MTALMAITGCSSVMTGRSASPGQHAMKLDTTIKKEVHLNYLLYIPDGYTSEGKSWPLILFLHGAGERGDDTELLKKHGPPKLVSNGKKLPFVVVSPQCPADNWWPNMLGELNVLIDEITKQYNIDQSRVYLTGLSMGGFGTWSLATDRPDRFAAIAPICGGGTPYLTTRLRNVPTWVFHGAKDQTVSIEKSEEMVEALRKNGGDVRFTVYPDAGHDSWTATYDNPELLEWFLSHRKR